MFTFSRTNHVLIFSKYILLLLRSNYSIVEWDWVGWRILQMEEDMLRWITSSEICIILHIIRKPNSFIVLFFIQNISLFLFNNFSSSKTLFKPFAYFPAQFFLAVLPIERFVLRILAILSFSFSLKFNYSGWSWTPFFQNLLLNN